MADITSGPLKKRRVFKIHLDLREEGEGLEDQDVHPGIHLHTGPNDVSL